MLIKGAVIEVKNKGKYIVVDAIELNKPIYVYLVNAVAPHDMIIAQEKFGTVLELKEITDNEQLKYMLVKLGSDTKTDDSKDFELQDMSASLRRNEEILEGSIKEEPIERRFSKNDYLMQQFSREVSNPNSDSFDRYMSNNSSSGKQDSEYINFVESLKQYALNEKARELSVDKYLGRLNQYEIDKYYKELCKAATIVIPVLSTIAQEYDEKGNDLEKSLAA